MKRLIALGDTHAPFQDQGFIDGICAYLEDTWVDSLVHVGDLLDFEPISKFVAGLPGLAEGKRLETEFTQGRAILNQLATAARTRNPKCGITLIEGNHEARLDKYLMANPELIGLISLPDLLGLNKLNATFVPFDTKGKVYNPHPDLIFTHGITACKYHAEKHVTRYLTSHFYGHTHDTQRHPLAVYGESKILVGQALGCSCGLSPAYIKGRPSNWQHAFGIFYLYPAGGGFQDQLITASPKRKFIAEGTEYSY